MSEQLLTHINTVITSFSIDF